MPELPEVEACRRRASRALVGRKIQTAEVADDPLVVRGTSPARLSAALRGRTVRAVRRRGKHLWIELDRRPWPSLHFGMTGWLEFYRRPEERPRFWKLELSMDDGRRMAFRDARRFGRLRLQQDPENEPPIALLGFDALDDLPSARDLRAHLARRRAPLKAVLLDQSLFAGVGNWIADEVLYQAKLSPRRLASSLTPAEVSRLRSRLRAVVRHAVKVGADSERFPSGWLFHRRWGRVAGATTHRAEAIVHETIGGRTTAWVPTRQR